MSFFAVLMIFFAVRRLAFGRYRMRRSYADVWGWHPYWQMHHRRGMMMYSLPTHGHFMPAAEPVAPAESRFDVLKRRYVTGELSDEQYEAALDELLKTPEGRTAFL